MTATRADVRDYRLPLHSRDICAHILIPLNVCRRKEHFELWKCTHERHRYEQCLYKESVAIDVMRGEEGKGGWGGRWGGEEEEEGGGGGRKAKLEQGWEES